MRVDASWAAAVRVVAVAMVALLSGCGGCSFGGGQSPPLVAPVAEAAPDYGGLFVGALGAAIAPSDRQAAYEALAQALDSLQRRSWKGERGVFGYFEPLGAGGSNCRTFAATIYVNGRAQKADGKACKSDAGDWRAAT